MQAEQLDRMVKFGEAEIINNDLNKIYGVLEKELKQSKKPDSIIGRVVVDSFGLIVLYGLLFTVCDFTRAMLTDGPFFGFKWLFFGPYYFFTKAPLMTRVWKSKKFLEDLSDFKKTDYQWPNERTCSSIQDSYTAGCNSEQNTNRHPVRDHLGHGLDWILSHLLGGRLGKFINNSTCEEQGNTLGHVCANDRVTAAYDCYVFFCSAYGISKVFDKNDPNGSGSFDDQTLGYDGHTKEAYRKYYEVYTAVYDIGRQNFGNSTHVPDHLNPTFDSFNQYCYNAGALFDANIFAQPRWYVEANGSHQGPCFFQQNYGAHTLDYWD